MHCAHHRQPGDVLAAGTLQIALVTNYPHTIRAQSLQTYASAIQYISAISGQCVSSGRQTRVLYQHRITAHRIKHVKQPHCYANTRRCDVPTKRPHPHWTGCLSCHLLERAGRPSRREPADIDNMCCGQVIQCYETPCVKP